MPVWDNDALHYLYEFELANWFQSVHGPVQAGAVTFPLAFHDGDGAPLQINGAPAGLTPIDITYGCLGGIPTPIFNGSTSRFDGGTNNAYAFTTGFTFSAWCYYQGNGGALGRGGNYRMGRQSGGVLHVVIEDLVAADFEINGGFIPLETWTHIGMAFSASEFLVSYINGSQVAELAGAVPNSLELDEPPFTVGCWTGLSIPTGFMTGGVRDIAMKAGGDPGAITNAYNIGRAYYGV